MTYTYSAVEVVHLSATDTDTNIHAAMQQHGFEPVTPVDHRAWLWVGPHLRRQTDRFTDSSQVVSLLSLTYSALCLGARLIGKWDLLWYDDAVIGLAYVCDHAVIARVLRD